MMEKLNCNNAGCSDCENNESEPEKQEKEFNYD